MTILQEYGIQNDLFNITFDNVKNNTTAIELFNQQLKSLIGNNVYPVRCVCHIINLIIQDGLKYLKIKFKILDMSSCILDFLHINTKNLENFIKFMAQNVENFH